MGQSSKKTLQKTRKQRKHKQWRQGLLQQGHHQELPTQCLKGTGKCHSATVSHSTEWAYFLWNTRCRLWKDMLDIFWEGDMSPQEQDTDPERRQWFETRFTWKIQVLWRVVWSTTLLKARPWHQGYEIIPMLSLFKTVPVNVACFSFPISNIKLNKVNDLHHPRRKSNSPLVQGIPAPAMKSAQFTCLIWLSPRTKSIFFFISTQFTKTLNKEINFYCT